MVYRKRCGICYNCDQKCVHGHKYKERKLFQIDMTAPTPFEDINMEENPTLEEDDHTMPTLEEVKLEVHQDEAIISLPSLYGISSPQTLKIQGYIKHRIVIVLIDSCWCRGPQNKRRNRLFKSRTTSGVRR